MLLNLLRRNALQKLIKKVINLNIFNYLHEYPTQTSLLINTIIS